MNVVAVSFTLGSFTFDLTIADLIAFSAIAVGGLFAWRYKRGDLWEETAREAQERNKVLNERLDAQGKRLEELESLPNLTRLYEMMHRHDEAERQVWDRVMSHYETTSLVLGGVATALEALNKKLDARDVVFEKLGNGMDTTLKVAREIEKLLRPPGGV